MSIGVLQAGSLVLASALEDVGVYLLDSKGDALCIPVPGC